MPKMNVTLAIVLMVLSCAWAVYAQTDFTVTTYNNATNTVGSSTTFRGVRAPTSGFSGGNVTELTYNNATNTTSSSTSSVTPGMPKVIAQSIYETTVASGAMEKGVLYTVWNPLATSTVLYYKDSAGVCRVASFPTVWKTMP